MNMIRLCLILVVVMTNPKITVNTYRRKGYYNFFGLNYLYDYTRRQILLKIVAPSINHASTMIIKVESDKSINRNVAAEKTFAK